MIEKLLAKSKLNGGTTLINHSKAVTNFMAFLFDKVINKDAEFTRSEESIEDLRNDAIALAAMHDIGKCSSVFQSFITGKSANNTTDDGLETSDAKKTKVTHNVLGWAYLNNCTNLSKEAKSAVLYHHVVFDYLSDITAKKALNVSKDELNVFNEFFDFMSSYCKEKFGVNISRGKLDTDKADKVVNTVFLYNEMVDINDMGEFDDNSRYFILRSLIVFADRIVSQEFNSINEFIDYNEDFMSELLNNMIFNNELPEDNVNELKNSKGEYVYNINRLKIQNDLLDEINKVKNAIVSASAGFGKTLVGLRWILSNKSKTLWVVPRNVIAEGTYQSLNAELNTMGITDKVSTALLLHGEYVEGNENADIIVTNIDNFLSMMVKNNMAHNLIKEIGGNVIFDEFHEFLSDTPLFAAFIGTLYTRVMFTNAKTLLLSATPIRFDKAFGMDKYISFITTTPFNGDMKVNIAVQEMENIGELKADWKDTFIFTNTVRHSQSVYDSHNASEDNTMLIHSRFPKTRRNAIESAIDYYHGKHSKVAERNPIVSTNILGVGIDASAKSTYDFALSPENTIQRGCGRTGRFAEEDYNNEVNYTFCILKDDKSTKKLITSTYSMPLYEKWRDLLKTLDGKIITKNDLYNIYYNFYKDNQTEANRMIRDFFLKSADDLKLMRPYSSHKKKSSKKNETLNEGLSYRGVGTSIYVVTKEQNSDNLCEPIIIDRNYIGRRELSDKAKKKHFEYLHSFVAKLNDEKLWKAFKVDNKNREISDCFKWALHKETPLYLNYATYSDALGLKVNVKPDDDEKVDVMVDDDDELD